MVIKYYCLLWTSLLFVTAGKANLALTAQKQFLQAQILELNNLKETIKATQKKINACDDESEEVEQQLQKAQDLYEKLKALKENYRVKFIVVLYCIQST